MYEDIASKFFEHFVSIAHSISDDKLGLWDEETGFFYDVVRPKHGGART